LHIDASGVDKCSAPTEADVVPLAGTAKTPEFWKFDNPLIEAPFAIVNCPALVIVPPANAWCLR
jgi:hypothetical protein